MRDNSQAHAHTYTHMALFMLLETLISNRTVTIPTHAWMATAARPRTQHADGPAVEVAQERAGGDRRAQARSASQTGVQSMYRLRQYHPSGSSGRMLVQ